MLKLKWGNRKSVDAYLLDIHIAHLKRHATGYSEFIMLIPISVYDHIKKIGINATITKLPTRNLPYMLWIRVSKIKDKPTNYINKKPVVAFDQFGRMLWKYPLPHRFIDIPKEANLI